MAITRDIVADKLRAYLHHDLTLDHLVDWAETALMDAALDDTDHDAIRDALARLGVADVRAFGLTWEDCEGILRRLGFTVHLNIAAV